MHFEWNIYVRFELESWRNILMSTSQGTYVPIEQTSDKSNIRNMQSGGARGLELRTAALNECSQNWIKSGNKYSNKFKKNKNNSSVH